MDRLARAKALREEADALEREANRPLPEKWKEGMRVRFLRSKDWAWSGGSEATVVELDEDCESKKGNEYQVFWTEPDGGGAKWWTTPDDVELVVPTRTVGEYDLWMKPCEKCGFDSAKIREKSSRRCWKCGSQLSRDFSDRALKRRVLDNTVRND